MSLLKFLPVTNGCIVDCLRKLWTSLQSIKHVELTFESNKTWSGVGSGIVELEIYDQSIVIREKGSWQRKNEVFMYTSSWRWTVDMGKKCIYLEHIRYGKDLPVALVSLFPQDDTTFTSCTTYRCENDQYNATVLCDLLSVEVKWSIFGPKKNEQIFLRYR